MRFGSATVCARPRGLEESVPPPGEKAGYGEPKFPSEVRWYEDGGEETVGMSGRRRWLGMS